MNKFHKALADHPTLGNGFLLFIVIMPIIVFYSLFHYCSVTNPAVSTVSNKVTNVPMVGQDAYLVAPMPYPHIAVDEASLDAYRSAKARNDIPYGITDLTFRNKLFQVENNIRCRILDKTFTSVKIRILAGDRTGSAGWVDSEWIKKTL